MKILVDNEEIFELTEIQKKVIKNDISEEIFEENTAKRCKYSAELSQNKYCLFNRKKHEAMAREEGLKTIPTDNLKLGVKVCCGEDKAVYSPLNCKCGPIAFEISVDHQKMCKYCNKDISINEMFGERMTWILTEKYERCLARLKKEWEPRLKAKGFTEFPEDEDEFITLIFNQSDYKSKSQREAESVE